MTVSLQQLTDAAGKWWQSQPAVLDQGLVFQWSVSTDFGEHSDKLKGCTAAKVIETHTNFGPGTLPPPGEYRISDVEEVTNEGDVSSEIQTLIVSSEISENYTWTLNETINVGVKVSGEVGVPLFAKGNVEVSTSLEFSAGQSESVTRTTTKTIQRDIVVPPKSIGTVTLYLAECEWSCDFISNIVIDGCAFFCFKNKNKKYIYGIFGLEWVVNVCRQNNLLDTTGYSVGDGNKILVASAGVLTGESASYSRTVISYRDWDGTEDVTNSDYENENENESVKFSFGTGIIPPISPEF